LLTHYAIKVRELVGLSRSEEDGYESDDGLEPGWSTPTWRRPASAVGVGRRDGGLTMPGRRVRLSTTEGVMMKRLVIVLLHETVTAANDDDEMRREEDVTAFSSVAAIGIQVQPTNPNSSRLNNGPSTGSPQNKRSRQSGTISTVSINTVVNTNESTKI
jgi:hypothetical protein